MRWRGQSLEARAALRDLPLLSCERRPSLRRYVGSESASQDVTVIRATARVKAAYKAGKSPSPGDLALANEHQDELARQQQEGK